MGKTKLRYEIEIVVVDATYNDKTKIVEELSKSGSFIGSMQFVDSYRIDLVESKKVPDSYTAV